MKGWLSTVNIFCASLAPSRWIRAEDHLINQPSLVDQQREMIREGDKDGPTGIAPYLMMALIFVELNGIRLLESTPTISSISQQ